MKSKLFSHGRLAVVLLVMAGLLALVPAPGGSWAGQYPYDGLDPEGPFAEAANCDDGIIIDTERVTSMTPWGEVHIRAFVELQYDRSCRVVWSVLRSDRDPCRADGRYCGTAIIRRNNDGAQYSSRVIFGRGVGRTRWWSPMLNDKNMTSFARGTFRGWWFNYSARTRSY